MIFKRNYYTVIVIVNCIFLLLKSQVHIFSMMFMLQHSLKCLINFLAYYNSVLYNSNMHTLIFMMLLSANTTGRLD